MNREEMEKRLRESNERHRLLLDRALEAIWFAVYEEPIDITLPEMEIARLISKTGIIVEANKAAAKECGFEETSQLIGRHWSEFVSFEENEEFYLKFVRGNYNIRGNTTVETDIEGNISHNESSLVGNIVDGKLVSSFGVGRDITERKQVQERVEHLSLVLRAIHNVNQLIVREKDRDRLIKSVCDNLVETRGYYNAWIALLGESGKLVAHAESGLGKDFLPMVEYLKGGQLPTCGQRALKQAETVVTKDHWSDCTDCPLSSSYGGRSAATTRLEHEGKIYGLLAVFVPREMATNVEELGLFHEVARDIAFALHGIELEEKRKKAEEELRESMQRHRFLMDNSIVGVWFSVFEEPIDITLPEAEIVRLMTEREVIVEANDALAKMRGLDRGSQLTGKSWSELDSAEYNLQSCMSMEIGRASCRERV